MKFTVPRKSLIFSQFKNAVILQKNKKKQKKYFPCNVLLFIITDTSPELFSFSLLQFKFILNFIINEVLLTTNLLMNFKATRFRWQIKYFQFGFDQILFFQAF